MTTAKTKVGKVKAREAMVVVVGARPPVPDTRFVRDRHTRRIVEVPMVPELPYLDEGDLGRSYIFTKDEEVAGDHEAVLDAPGAFEPVED